MSLPLVFAAISTVASVSSAVSQRKAAREQRRLQRLRERRERNKLFAEQRRAAAEARAQLAARGASISSAAETVPGSISTQGATNQQFLTEVSTLSRSANAFLQRANTFGAVGQVSGQLKKGAEEGMFDFLNKDGEP